jgi:SAM-dependent MidA family methyltransferase
MFSWLAEMAAADGGRIRFDRFMELALYDPEHGYYSRAIENVGRGGDFATTATLSNILGQAIAGFVRAETRRLRPTFAKDFGELSRVAMAGRLGRPSIIELGPGNGRLADEVLRQLPRWRLRRYLLVEVTKRLTPRYPPRVRRRASFCVDLNAAAATASGYPILFGNEFVDAFPCRRFRRTETGWSEGYLVLNGETWTEQYLAIDQLPESTVWELSWPIGQVVEVHAAFRDWLDAATKILGSATVVLIDYGDRPEAIYQRRIEGSLRAYYRHQRLTGREIYLRVGLQDLTCDVNFADLVLWSKTAGWTVADPADQREFILEWYPGAAKLSDPVSRQLLEPEGAGGAFKVLILRKA